MAQFTLARVSRQLREELNTRELEPGEAQLLEAIERDIERWDELRKEQDVDH